LKPVKKEEGEKTNVPGGSGQSLTQVLSQVISLRRKSVGDDDDKEDKDEGEEGEWDD
jgi:hypothetical protein